MALRVEPLAEHHNRPAFACGVTSLDRYIWQQAGQDQRRNLAVCFVLSEPPSGEPSIPSSVTIAGYYTLCMTAIRPSALPESAAKRLGRFESYPALLLGRLAVDQRHRAQGHGEFLLLDAMRRTVALSEQAGAIALVVDALDGGAERFYERFGFVRFQDAELRPYLPIRTCRATIEAVLSREETGR